MAQKDFVVSADGHLLEPIDLFKTRLPEHLRDRAVWEEDFEIEPFVEGGARVFRKLHTPGYEGWTVSRYRQTSGRTPEGDPELILEDMDIDGVDVQVMHPNLSLFGLYSDDHELSIAHARVYNDYVDRAVLAVLRPAGPDGADPAHRHRRRRHRDRAGRRRRVPGRAAPRHRRRCRTTAASSTRCGPPSRPPACSCSSTPRPAASRSTTPRPLTLKVVLENAAAGQPADDREGGGQADGHPGGHTADRPAAAHLPADRRRRARALPGPALLADRVQRPLAVVARRLAWTSAGSPASARTPTGGSACGTTPAPTTTSPNMAQLFRLNEKWPYPLMPSEYVQRQFHVQFQDDPVAVACRHITGLSTVMWGNDYPHAEGTFRGSQELLAAAVRRRPRRRAQGDRRRHARRPARLRAGPGLTGLSGLGIGRHDVTSQPTSSGGGRDRARFDGRVAIVTGAGRGIGRAYALLLAERGARRWS